MIQDINKILVLRPDGIGDALNATPAISALRGTYRDAHLSVVLRPPGAEILSLNPHIDEVIIYDPDGLHSSLAAKLRFLRRLRAESYDMTIVLMNSSWCNFTSYVSGARYRIGRKSGRKGFRSTLTDGVRSRDPKGTKHEVDRNIDVTHLAGAEHGNAELALCLSTDERAWAQDFIRSKNADPASLLVGIHPGGSSFDKLWPAENFAYVADQLAQKPGTRIMLFSGPGEDDLVDKIRGTMTHSPISATGISLRKSAVLIERCSLFICNDSGPMHIAAALKVPTVALFGPTDYVRWRPRNEKAVIVRRDMDCWPCSIHRCPKEFECIKSLPVDDVLDATYSILDT